MKYSLLLKRNKHHHPVISNLAKRNLKSFFQAFLMPLSEAILSRLEIAKMKISDYASLNLKLRGFLFAQRFFCLSGFAPNYKRSRRLREWVERIDLILRGEAELRF